MVHVAALWLPILVAAILVFVVSSIIHTVLSYHAADFKGVPDEPAVRAALGPLDIPPGDYIVPYASSGKERQSEEFKAKVEEGPVAFMHVLGPDSFNMGSSLVQWFVYCVLTGTLAAYVTGIAYGPGAGYMEVFRMSGTVAFAAYGWALLQNSIWFKKNWAATGRSLFDSLVYGLVTAGALGWLWPG